MWYDCLTLNLVSFAWWVLVTRYSSGTHIAAGCFSAPSLLATTSFVAFIVTIVAISRRSSSLAVTLGRSATPDNAISSTTFSTTRWKLRFWSFSGRRQHYRNTASVIAGLLQRTRKPPLVAVAGPVTTVGPCCSNDPCCPSVRLCVTCICM